MRMIRVLVVCQALFQAPVIPESTEYLRKPYEVGGLPESQRGSVACCSHRAARRIAGFDPKPLWLQSPCPSPRCTRWFELRD